MADNKGRRNAGAENHMTRGFFTATRAIYGPMRRHTAPLRSKRWLHFVKDKEDILNRWQEHFSELLNRDSRVEPDTIYNIPQTPIRTELDELPLLEEVRKAIAQMKNNKASGSDDIPSEIYKHGGEILTHHLHHLFQKIWNTEETPKDLKDVMVVTIFKKGDRADCDNFRGSPYHQLAERFLPKSCSTDYHHYRRDSYLKP